ncbi:MAG: aspartate--tRNA(Asn) ligase [Candidatus Micrarchaeota archaeon]|nr:aspartate--tRNA(Asn) ligase [Candidatus Micrarchaeota archaeon]
MMRTHYISDAKSQVNKTVTLCGWAHEVRDIGKVRFLMLRDRSGLVQVFAKKNGVPDDVFEAMVHPKETVLAVTGKVVESKIATGGIEVVPEKIEVLGALSAKVPIDLTGQVPAELDTRLDHRYVDLRQPTVAAIFRIKAHVAQAFRASLVSQGFEEIHPTSLVAAATEGGADLFKVQYFEREACLSQSPQLYKQLAVVGGMDKVFMTTPAFRAEKHNTLHHLNEVLQMDAELGFADDNDGMDVLERTFLDILKHVSTNCKSELDLLKAPLQVPAKVNRYTYTELVEKLNAAGTKMEWGDDFDREKEAKLFELLGEEAFFIKEWPTAIRAFYSMPRADKPEICKAYDLMYRGLEISSGAQRIHIPELLIEQLKGRGLDPDQFKFYVDAFRVGAPPHAGWSIGIERLVMKICQLHNIREASMFPRDRNRLTP